MRLRYPGRSVLVILFVLCLAGCFGGVTVKNEIREVVGCLDEGKTIDATERCFKELSLRDLVLHEREKSYFLLDTVKTACEDESARNCSSERFIENLVVEKREGFDVVINPSIQISSRSGNIGGSLVQLVIFYEGNGNVVGWYNWKPVKGISFSAE